MRNFLKPAIVGVAVCVLTGCASVQLHDEAAAKAAASAKADYDASKLTDSVKLGRAVFSALDAKELDAFRSMVLAERDLELLSLLQEPDALEPKKSGGTFIPRFTERANARMALLVGSSPGFKAAPLNLDNPREFSVELRKRDITLRDAQSTETRARNALVVQSRQEGMKRLPACNADVAALQSSTDADNAIALINKPDLKLEQHPLKSTWTPHIQEVGKQCAEVLNARTSLLALQASAGGQYATALAAVKALEEPLAQQQAEVKTQSAALKQATKALADAQKATKDAAAPVDLTCPSTAEAVVPAAAAPSPEVAEKKNELCKVLDKLADLKSFGVTVVSEERLDQINAILGALGGAQASTKDPKLEPGLALLSTTSRFAQALTQYQQAGKLPALEPLLIEKEMTTAQLAQAKLGEQLALAKLAYAKDYLAATLLEASQLSQATAELSPDGPDPQGRKAYRAMALLSESFSVARDRQLTAEIRTLNVAYREAMGQSEASLASWNALLSVAVNQLKDYHDGGIKPAAVASLAAQVIQALAAVGIAVNVK